MEYPRLRYDVFLSYSWRNRALAEQLHAALLTAGLSVFRDATAMQDYDEISPQIDRGLRGARCLLALYTPEFPLSAYCRWELHTALWRAYQLDGNSRRVMATVHGVDYGDVRPSRLTDLRLPSPTAGVDLVAGSVAASVRRVDDRTFGDALALPAVQWYPEVSPAHSRFCGRLAELWALHEALVVTDPTQRSGPPVVRVEGLGGMGKSMLAGEYAHRFAADHPGGVFVFRYSGAEVTTPAGTLRLRRSHDQQIAAIAARIGVRVAPEQASAALRRHFHDGQAYLWLLDDLPRNIDTATLRHLLPPTSHGHVLITSQYAHEELGGVRIELGALEPRDAIELLTSRRQIAAKERVIVGEMANDLLGGHPQALELAASMSTYADLDGFAGLRATLDADDRDALELAAELRSELPGGHAASIAATFLRSIRRLSSAGMDVLRVLSLLAPLPVPERLLTTALADNAHALAGLSSALELGLVGCHTEASAVVMHSLLIRTLRVTDTNASRRVDLRNTMIEYLIDRLDATRDALDYPQLAPYLPHVEELAAGGEFDALYVRQEAGRAFVELGDYARAKVLQQRLYEACRARLGGDDPTTLAALASLGVIHGLHGEHHVAERLKRRVLRALEHLLGEAHPDTLTAQNNLGVTQLDRHDPTAARATFSTVYRRRRDTLGHLHTETLTALGNVASAAAAQGRHQLAFRLRIVVHERLGRRRGTHDLLTMEALNNLAASHWALGDEDAAANAFRRVLEARTTRLGGNHVETLAVLANLAVVTAEPERKGMLESAYRQLVMHSDPGSPVALRVLHNLLIARNTVEPPPEGATYVDQEQREDGPLPADLTVFEDLDDDADRRVRLFLMATRIHDRLVDHLGPNHVETMMAGCHVAHATGALGQFRQQLDGALVIATDTVEGLREVLGANHPDARLAERIRQWLDDREALRD